MTFPVKSAPESRRSKVPVSRVVWLALILAGLVGIGAVIKARKTKDGPAVDLREAPVVPGATSDQATDQGLPIAGTTSSDGGLGAAAVQS
jgi:hypothetical protein